MYLEIELESIPLAESHDLPRKPNNGCAAVGLDPEVLQHGRFDLLVELGRELQFLGPVATSAVFVGGDELLGQDAVDHLDVAAQEGGVPVALELHQVVLVRPDRATLGEGGSSQGGDHQTRGQEAVAGSTGNEA